MKLKLLVLILIISQVGHAQNLVSDKIIFLDYTPVVDGKLDDKLLNLTRYPFNYFFRFDNPNVDSIDVSYRMAYTPSHLYLYIETKGDSITYRDRGFINGDGFKLLLAMPQKDSLTDEYYDIVFSASKDKNYWARKRIWDFNRKQNSGKKLSIGTQFEEKCYNGRCGFEVLLAWKDIEPYHPWFSEELGYNLYFAKAINNNNAVGYTVVKDEGIWDEEVPKRNYIRFNFEKPKIIKTEFIDTKLSKRNLVFGEPLLLNSIAISDKNRTHSIKIEIQNDSSKVVLTQYSKLKINKKFKKELLKININRLPTNHYTLFVKSDKESIAKYDFTVFPKLDFNDIRSSILNNTHSLQLGTINTLLFKINMIELNLKKLKVYETGKELLDEYNRFETEYSKFLNGTDPYRGITKTYRRAFKSTFDNTLQPYSIKLPTNYDPAKKYPLLVFLHGSGQDEQGLLNSARSKGDFIELAPFARDMYRCYSSDSSQNDILEAIEDVKLHFSVDKEKIIIGGFSMGGYGAMRTFFEHPSLYKGVAVFAGHPNLANEWLGEGHPNFLEDKFLTNFSNIPIFIFHGRDDGALPISKTEELIIKLKSTGIAITERLIENKAHEYPDEETNKKYFEWLTKIVGN